MRKEVSQYILPEGWALAVIDDLIGPEGLFMDGDWIESKDQNLEGDVRLIQLADIGDGYFKDRSNKFMNKKNAFELNCTFLQYGDILLARMPDPLGRCTIFPLKEEEKYVTVVDIAIIRTGEMGVNNKYLMYFLNSPIIRKRIELLQTGTTRRRISRGNLSKLKIPVPPLNEQLKIINKIEELYSKLEHTENSLEKFQKQLDVYKQIVYINAFEGKLSSKWSLQTSSSNWSKKKLGQLVANKSQKIHPKNGKNYKFIGMDSIRPNEMTPFKFYDFSKLKSAGNYFKKDQVLYGRMRPYLNKLYKAEFEGVSSGEFIVMECSEFILPDYLKHILHSKDFVKYATSKASGDRPRISFADISEYNIPLCSIEEQQYIVDAIESKMSVCKKIEETILNTLSRTHSFKQSILKKAFEGSLVSQDIAEEPASVLLSKIKQGRTEYILKQNQLKQKLPRKIKLKNMSTETKSILQLLKDSKKPIASRKLWQDSEHKEDIDSFYEKLKELIDSGEVKEGPRKGKESFLIINSK